MNSNLEVMADGKTNKNNMMTDKSLLLQETNDSRRNVLIVGGGPTGLATALMLAKRGWTNITVLEKRPTADYYEPDKSFNYLIDGRGQKLTDFLGLTHELAQISVPNTEFYLTRIKPNGSGKTVKLPMVDPNRKTAYWLPRRDFILLLYQEIERNWQDRITVLFNTKCVQIISTPGKVSYTTPVSTIDPKPHLATTGVFDSEENSQNPEEKKLEILAQTENGNTVSFEPCLLIGCDGLHSIVRNTIKEWDKSTSNRFEMKCFPSPSSGLRYKVLRLPPKFPLDHSDKEHAVSTMAYAIRGAFRDSKRSVSLGLLPLKNPDAFRTANIITRPDNEIWELKNSEEVYNFFEKAFPQLPIRQIISSEEAEQFAKSEGGYFPTPQYCSGLYFLLRQEQVDKSNPSSATSVVLLGDAIHCFPPDIGQGVNSALEDAYILNEALSQSNDDLSHALPLYESLRIADVKALVRLAQFAFPWQYNQAPLRTRLWSVNFFLRLILSRLLPYIFSPPAFFMIQNHRLSYEEIFSKAQRSTQTLYVFGLIIICGFLVLGASFLHQQVGTL